MASEKKETESKIDVSSILIKMGLVVLALSFLAFMLFYFPVIIQEIKYAINKPNIDSQVSLPKENIGGTENGNNKQKENTIVAADKEFSIVIPKIGANSKVIKDVNPYNSKVYQQGLTKGVAHADGTPYPGEYGNSFYFAHSSDNFYNANRYNSVFYLLNKLNKGDLFYLIYNKQIFKYTVTNVQVVNASDVDYLEGDVTKKTATLMTCWPAGTTLERYIVVGEIIN
jgi:LPXTG-site transpeptidase (sortase) family protein